MSQLMMQESPKHGLGLCPVGSIVGKKPTEPFLLDENDMFLHALIGGPIEPQQTKVFQVLEGDGAGSALRSGDGQGTTESLEADLTSFLKEKLPIYMVPSQFVLLEALPLSPNGKVNRKSLPEPDHLEVQLPVALVDPRNEIEQKIARIWEEVLQMERVGIHSNFFDLGGNSIHVVQVHGKVRHIFKKDVPIIEMFNRPTIASLAEYLSPDEVKQDTLAQSHDRAEFRRALRKQRNQSRNREG